MIHLTEPLMRIFLHHRNKRDGLSVSIKNDGYKRPTAHNNQILSNKMSAEEDVYGPSTADELSCCCWQWIKHKWILATFQDVSILSLLALTLFLFLLVSWQSKTTTTTSTSTTTTTTTSMPFFLGRKRPGKRRRAAGYYDEGPKDLVRTEATRFVSISKDINDEDLIQHQETKGIHLDWYKSNKILCAIICLEVEVLDTAIWLSMIDEMWNNNGEKDCTAFKSLCRMNRMALEAPSSTGTVVSLSR